MGFKMTKKLFFVSMMPIIWIFFHFFKKNLSVPSHNSMSLIINEFKSNISTYSTILSLVFLEIFLISIFSSETSGSLKWIPYITLPLLAYFVFSFQYKTYHNFFYNSFIYYFFLIFILFKCFNKLHFDNFLIFSLLQILFIFIFILLLRMNFPKLLIRNKKFDFFLILLTIFFYLLLPSLLLLELTNFSYFVSNFKQHFPLSFLGSCLVLLAICLFLFFDILNKYLNLIKFPFFVNTLKNKPNFDSLLDVFIIIVFGFLSFRSDSLFEMTVSGNPVYHWDYYVGVINSVRNGGYLLWNIPSQYGFLNLLLPVIIKTNSAWQSFYIFQGLLLFLTSTAFYIYFIKNGKHIFLRLMFFALILMALFFADPDFFGPYPFPSSSVVRFFFVYVILFFLATQNKFSIFNAFLLALIWSLGFWWSSESALYVSAIYLFTLFALIIYCTKIVRSFQLIAAYLLFPLVFFASELIFLLIFYKNNIHFLPDFYAFLEHGLGYAGGFGYVKFSFTGPGFYLLFGFTSLCFLCYQAIRKNDHLKQELIIPLFASTGALWAISSYFIGRPVPQNITAMMPLILIIFLIPISLLNNNSAFKFQLNTHKLIILPFLFLILIPLFNSHWLSTVRHLRSFSEDITKNLPKADKELSDLLRSSRVTRNANIVYYSDDGAQPNFTDDLFYINSVKNDWLPRPLQILEEPVTKERRDIYLNRHLCLKSNNEVFLIVKKSDIIYSRANSFIKVINNYYYSSMIFENHSYKLIKFSEFNNTFCPQ